MLLATTENGDLYARIYRPKMLETELKHISKSLNANIIQENPNFLNLEKQLSEYFEGKQNRIYSSFGFCGKRFSKTVWEILMKIPYGQTSYAKQAEILGIKNKFARLQMLTE